MRFPRISFVLVVALFLALPSADARAHWCDDLWTSAYHIVVRPDSDTSPKALYVENSMGYQLVNFKLMATDSKGSAITLTPPTTLKMANTLLPGEKGVWKISAGSPAKIEDLTFSVTFGNTSGSNSKQYDCYPVVGASPVMIVKTDGSLYPSTPTGLDNPKSPTSATGCTFNDTPLGRSLQNQAIADWEDLDLGLDKILQLFCSGRASWGTEDGTTKTYCKDTSSTTCPTNKPSGVGSYFDYMHLWGAGALAIRKESLGARLPVFRERLKCAVNDGDVGFAGYPLFILGYLGDDAGAKSFLQTKASASDDLGTIAKASLYLMGDTTQKAAVQAGVKSSSVFVKVACAAALGIVDKDDAQVTSTIFPEVKWNEPDIASEDGKGMYAAHMLEIVAFHRRGWVFRGLSDGPVTFYGETDTGGISGAGGKSGTDGTGGISGGGGTTGKRDGGSGASSGNGGAVGKGGRSGGGGVTAGEGGASGLGASPGVGGAEPGSGGVSGTGGDKTAGGSSGSGSSSVSSGGNGSGTTGGGEKSQGSGCKCSFGRRPDVSAISFLALAGLALMMVRRRRH
jgi:hypothetical protein